MAWDWNIGVILMVLGINVVGWAFTLGKSAGKAKSGDARAAEQTKAVIALQEDCKQINITLAVVGNRVGTLEGAITNGLTAGVAACNVSIATLQQQVESHANRDLG